MLKFRVGVVAAGFVLLLSACGSKPEGQTVAVVNGEEISLGELNAELASANVPASADKKTVMPQLLQRVVDRRLMAQRASDQGIDQTPEFVTQQRRQDEDLLIRLASKRLADTGKLPNAGAVEAFMAANPDMFANRTILRLDQLQFIAPTGEEQLKTLQGDHSIAELSASLAGMGIAFVRTETKMDSATVPPAVLKQIYALPPGEPFIVPIAGRMYASVITGRERPSTTPEENRRIAVEAMRQKTLNEALDRELKQARAAAKIEYQQGYAPAAPNRQVK